MLSKVSSTKTKTAAVQMEMIATSLDTFRLDVGSYPNTIIQLRNSNTVNWDGPYLPKMGLWTYRAILTFI
jgi:general secretion pathway protein G